MLVCWRGATFKVSTFCFLVLPCSLNLASKIKERTLIPTSVLDLKTIKERQSKIRALIDDGRNFNKAIVT